MTTATRKPGDFCWMNMITPQPDAAGAPRWFEVMTKDPARVGVILWPLRLDGFSR